MQYTLCSGDVTRAEAAAAAAASTAGLARISVGEVVSGGCVEGTA